MNGETLIKELSQATDLPDQVMEKELHRLLEESGLSTKDVTLDDLRTILANYLQDVLVETKEQLK